VHERELEAQLCGDTVDEDHRGDLADVREDIGMGEVRQPAGEMLPAGALGSLPDDGPRSHARVSAGRLQ
jgi:hypothetical protein